MNRKWFFVVFAAVSLCKVDGFLKVLELFKDVTELGLEIFKAIDGKTNQYDVNTILSEMKTVIDTSTAKIITTVLLQPKLNRIDDAVIAIKSSLGDLSFILKANDTENVQKYKELYRKRYDDDQVHMHLSFLPELLEYTIPGTNGLLIDLFTEQTRCNMTAIDEFVMFYYNLVSGGLAAEFAYLTFSNISITDTLNLWKQNSKLIETTFNNKIISCEQQFGIFATQDIERAVDGLTLWNNNNQRYNWLWNSVLFLKPYGTFQFLYLKYAENSNSIIKTQTNRIAIFTDKSDAVLPASALSLLENSSALQSAILGGLNELTAKHIGVAAQKHLLDNGYDIKALVVFFDGDEFAADFIKFENESQLIMATLPVKLEYCYSSWITCKVHSDGDTNVITSEKIKAEVSGLMKVVAYVEATSPGKPKTRFKTGTGTIVRCYPIILYLLLTIILCL